MTVLTRSFCELAGMSMRCVNSPEFEKSLPPIRLFPLTEIDALSDHPANEVILTDGFQLIVLVPVFLIRKRALHTIPVVEVYWLKASEQILAPHLFAVSVWV